MKPCAARFTTTWYMSDVLGKLTHRFSLQSFLVVIVLPGTQPAGVCRPLVLGCVVLLYSQHGGSVSGFHPQIEITSLLSQCHKSYVSAEHQWVIPRGVPWSDVHVESYMS
ncbi:hypothetical protein LZ30DRAFT_718117 [Colletotrichum cereale]|nr:hypothetical protein LZ30DRAFT_718117 [Colletotrichum cereale]